MNKILSFQFLGVSPQCGSVERSGLTPAEIRELVDVHNKYRAFVASGKEKRGNPGPQPAARDMEPLVNYKILHILLLINTSFN